MPLIQLSRLTYLLVLSAIVITYYINSALPSISRLSELTELMFKLRLG